MLGESSTPMNTCSPSTRVAFIPEKITTAPQGTGRTSPEASLRAALSSREIRLPLSQTWQFTGGSEAWIVVKARGATWRFPGHTSVLEVLLTVNKY